MVCGSRNVLQADKARPVQAVQQLFGILQDMLNIKAHSITLLAAQAETSLCSQIR